jgi:flagellar biosynthesis/type III secretory pathway chaperone
MHDFLELLFLEKAVHEELLVLALKKKDVLIANDVSSLEDIVAQERILLKKVRELERKRGISAGEIAKALDIEKGEVTFDEIEKHAGDKYKKQAKQVRGELILVLSKLSDCNRINTELIRTHLDYTYFSLDMMTKSSVSADTYDGSGYMKEDGKNRIGLIDQKV